MPRPLHGRAGEGYGGDSDIAPDAVAEDQTIRERATTAREFDPAEIRAWPPRRKCAAHRVAVLPLVVVVSVNLLMSLVCPAAPRFLVPGRGALGRTTLSAVVGVWSVAVALAAAILTLVLINRRRLPALRESMDAGANASVLPTLSVASLVGFGAVVAALPAFAVVRDWCCRSEAGRWFRLRSPSMCSPL